MLKTAYIFVLLICIATSYNEFTSYSHGLVFGKLPIFNLTHYVTDAVKEVPEIFTHIISKLDDRMACKKKIFRLKGSITHVEDEFRSYIHTKKLPVFECFEDAGHLLIILIKRLDRYLISKDHMKKLDEVMYKLKDVEVFAKEHLDLFVEVFEQPFVGKALLSALLRFFARFVNKGCIKGGYFEFVPLVAPELAEIFMDCSWMFRCSEFSRNNILLRLLRLGHDNLAYIFSHTTSSSSSTSNNLNNNLVSSYESDKKNQRSIVQQLYSPSSELQIPVNYINNDPLGSGQYQMPSILPKSNNNIGMIN